jgi:hypothetical protein
MAEKNIDMDKVQFWMKWTDEDGEEHFEKMSEVTDDCSFSLDDAIDEDNEADDEEYTAEDVKSLCAKTLREKYFLEGMVAAYNKVLGIDDADDDEE